MDELKSYFQDKRNLVSLLSLLILTLALPLAIFLVRNQQIYSSRAAGGPPIKFSGANVVTRAGKLVATSPQVVVELSAPYPPRVLSANANMSLAQNMSLVKTVYAFHPQWFGNEGCWVCNRDDEDCDNNPDGWEQVDNSLCGAAGDGGSGGGTCTDPNEFNQPGPCVSCSSAYFCCDSNPDICDVFGAYPGQCDSDSACTGGGAGGGGVGGCSGTSCYTQAGCSSGFADQICQANGAQSCDPENEYPDGNNPYGDGCRGYPSEGVGSGGNACEGYFQVCWEDVSSDPSDPQYVEGTQWCEGGSTIEGEACGYDSALTKRCVLEPGSDIEGCKIINPQQDCPANATACWIGAGCSDQQGADTVCAQNYGTGSVCTQTEGQQNTNDSGCTIPGGPTPSPSPPTGITPSIIPPLTIPPSSQSNPYPPGSKQTATVNFKDAGHVDTYYIGPVTGTGGSGAAGGDCTYPGLEGCVRQCQPVFNRPLEHWVINGKIVLDDNCWQLTDFTTPSGITCKDGRPSRADNCVPVTCTNFDPKIHYDPVNACFGGQVLQASTTGTSTRVKTLSSGESGKQFDWTAPATAGKYQFVANAHKITLAQSSNHNNDWNQAAPYNDKGCAWDGFVYLPGTPLQKTNETCSNTGPKEFWVGTGTGSPGPVPPGPGPRSPSPGPKSPSPGPRSPSPVPAGLTTLTYKLAENPSDLDGLTAIAYTEPLLRNHTFADQNPGIKFIWVEFAYSDGKKERFNNSIELIGPNPDIQSCRLDIAPGEDRVIFHISGNGFGTEQGSIQRGQKTLAVTGWANTTISAEWNKPPVGESFPITLTRKDGQKVEGVCSSITQIFFAGRLFCPQVDKNREFKAELAIREATPSAKLKKDTVPLKGGILKDFSTNLQEGASYRLSIKVERGLRKLFNLVAVRGTMNISNLILPLGDIYPTDAGDGKINSFDKAELNRQWGTANANKNCDLNGDKVCNSFEWACMREFFGKDDEQEP